jgi:GT2 family glycosyltransferase
LKVIIVIVSYNFNAFLQKSLDNIKALLKDGTYRTVVVDNGSADGSAEYLASRNDILFIQNENNRGFGPACNQGVQATMGTEFEDADVFLLNNDALITAATLTYLERALYSADDIGAVGCVSNSAGNRQQLDIQFRTSDEYLEFGNDISPDLELETKERVRLSGFAMLIRRGLWDDIGGFDEDFVPGYFEDDALSMEITRRGYRMLLVENSFVYHAGSMSFARADQNEIVTRNAGIFIDKYGFNPVDFAYGDEILALTIPLKRDEEFELLQYRSGLGADLKVIKDLFPNSHVCGIEDRKELREISGHTEKIYRSIEEAASGDSSFDILVIDADDIAMLSQQQKEALVGLCKPDALLLNTNHKYVYYPFDEVKMVQWDDGFDADSFNLELVRMLTRHGIVNSISPDSDQDKAKELLAKAGILDKFVFFDGGLSGGEILKVTDHRIVPYLCRYYEKLVERDPDEKKLWNMKVLEAKENDRRVAASEETFLYDSDIHITINRNCMDVIDEIEGLILTADKLNFTGLVEGKKQLIRLLSDDWNETAYICARDKYCDYGVAGFYCINHWEDKAIHFLFSDGLVGMGIAGYVYEKLEEPELELPVPKEYAGFGWITDEPGIVEESSSDRRIRILIRGDEKLSAVADYLDGGRVTREFYTGSCSHGDINADLRDDKLLSGDYNFVVYSLLADKPGDIDEIFERLDNIYDRLEGRSEIILLLGPEQESEWYSFSNGIITEYAEDHPGISIVNYTDFVDRSRDLFCDETSYRIAGRIADIING